MEVIYTDKNFKEQGFLKHASLDIEIGKHGDSANDFEIQLSTEQRDSSFDEGSLFYKEETEWGGIVESKKVDTATKTLTLKGKTFRGMLEKEVVQPPEGSTHLKLQGEANEALKTMIANRFDDLFTVVEETSGIIVNYQVRDMNLLEAIEKTLKTGGARLNIKFTGGKVQLQAEKVQDLSDSLQFDNNYRVNLTVETKRKPYSHILALGSGELLERLRLNIYRQEDASWGDAEFYAGLQRNTYLYEDTNAEDAEELRANAIASAEEAEGTDTLDVSFDSDSAELFDVVGAKEEITGIEFKQPITQKILKGTIYNGRSDIQISYKVGG